jgi:hypothetical protein
MTPHEPFRKVEGVSGTLRLCKYGTFCGVAASKEMYHEQGGGKYETAHNYAGDHNLCGVVADCVYGIGTGTSPVAECGLVLVECGVSDYFLTTLI